MMNNAKYSLRDHLLSLCDSSNWPELSEAAHVGYSNAMEEIHEVVMEFCDNASSVILPAVESDSVDRVSVYREALERISAASKSGSNDARFLAEMANKALAWKVASVHK